MRGGERGFQGTAEKKQRIGDGYFINDTISEPYGYEINTREVERNNQREIMKAKLLKVSGDGGIDMKHKCKRIRRGNYEYRGYIIQCVGYYHPDHRITWEACPKGEIYADFHGFSLREVKIAIDCDLDK